MAGIYIHIPFCRKLCGYCDFFKSISLRDAGRVYEALLEELSSQAAFLGGQQVNTVYFGGGTPTTYSPGQLQGLLERVVSLWDCSRLEEVTLEANPEDLTDDCISELSRTGINRLSIGVQSFDDGVLAALGRRHDAQRAVRAVQAAQDAGFGNITIDLMYGLPFSDTACWERTLRAASELGVQHISAYHLTIEPGTVFGRQAQRGQLEAVDESVSTEQYDLLRQVLGQAGFGQYEVSNFARPGFRSRHNSGYWTGMHYLGVGPGAHSFDGRRRRWAVSNIARYLSGQDIYTCEELTPEQIYDEYLMTSMRRVEGIDTAELERRFGACKLQCFTRAADRLVRSGLLESDGRRYRIPPEKFLLSDMIICSLAA